MAWSGWGLKLRAKTLGNDGTAMPVLKRWILWFDQRSKRLPVKEPFAQAPGADLVFANALGVDVPIESGPFHAAAVGPWRVGGCGSKVPCRCLDCEGLLRRKCFRGREGGEEGGVGLEKEGLIVSAYWVCMRRKPLLNGSNVRIESNYRRHWWRAGWP